MPKRPEWFVSEVKKFEVECGFNDDDNIRDINDYLMEEGLDATDVINMQYYETPTTGKYIVFYRTSVKRG